MNTRLLTYASFLTLLALVLSTSHVQANPQTPSLTSPSNPLAPLSSVYSITIPAAAFRPAGDMITETTYDFINGGKSLSVGA